MERRAIMTKKEPSTLVAYWVKEIKAAKKREDRYRKMGKEVMSLYGADDDEYETPFNILYSNTETLRPALYSAQPRSVVQRRFKDDDPLGKLASDANRRMLDYHLDTNKEDYETLNDAMGSAVLDALLPGRGMIQVKYDANFVPIDEPRPPDEHDDDPITESHRAEYAEKEQVCYESVLWDRVHIGYAKKWNKVPWIAYESHLTKEEVAGLLGKKIAGKLTYSKKEGDEEDKSGKEDEKDGARKTACIYQIWDKAGGRKVRYISPNYVDGELKVDDDPLGLTGFFNTPRPLVFVEKSSSLVPTSPYKMYKSQADELNRLTRRIKAITEAIKARGLYLGNKGADIEKLMTKDDNALVPLEATSLAGLDKGIQDLIWFMPLDVLIAVLQQLYQARDACKQVIYEITGIADIMRGASNASETLGAQKIKNQWGTLRLKRMQAEVQRYVRDLLRMTAEIAGKQFDEETWAKMTGLPFMLTAQRQQLDQQVALYTQSGQPLTPQMQQQLGVPVWGSVLKVLNDDAERSFRIDIETNSTVQPEAAEDQEGITTLLTAFGQTMQSIGPLVLQGVLPFQAAQNLLLFISRRFRFGDQIEDEIKAMQPPKPQDDGKAQAAQAQMQQKMMELDKQHGIKEIEYKQKESEMALKQQTMQAEADHKQREMDLQYREAAQGIKEQQFGLQQQVEKGMFDMQKQHATQEIGTRDQLQSMKEKKFNTESVVGKKADSALGQGVGAMKELVQQLAEMVAQQAQQNQQMIHELTTAITKPRTKKAIRGKDGKIEAVEEMVA
jgi:hypothetical protein